jgi:hypothetical protein
MKTGVPVQKSFTSDATSFYSCSRRIGSVRTVAAPSEDGPLRDKDDTELTTVPYIVAKFVSSKHSPSRSKAKTAASSLRASATRATWACRPNVSVTGERFPCWCKIACTWFFSAARCCPNEMRKRTCCGRSRAARSAIQASGNNWQRSRCASVAESTRSFFNFADAIAFARCGCTR